MKFFRRKDEEWVKIVPNQDFLIQKQRFVKGKTYKVPLSLARVYDTRGWLEDSIAEPLDEEEVTLDIHNSVLGMEDSNG